MELPSKHRHLVCSSTIPAIYVGTYGGTWATDPGITTQDPSNSGNWTISVDQYGFVSGNISSTDGTFTDTLSGVVSGGILVGYGVVITSFQGQITGDGSQIDGAWFYTNLLDPGAGTFTGTKQ